MWVLCLAALAVVASGSLTNNDAYFDDLEVLQHHTLQPPFFPGEGALKSRVVSSAHASSSPVGNTLHEWRFVGHAVTSPDWVRLTSMLKGQTGVLFNEAALDTTAPFEVFYEVNVHGEAGGADGMAMWLTADPVKTGGPLLGGPEKWNGVSVQLDSFDNDNRGDNPRVSVLLNDGTKEVKSDTDGHAVEASGCLYGYRNVEGGVTVHLKYHDGLLDVTVGHRTAELHDFFPCAMGIVVKLPPKVHLSVTGHTGDIFDNHDVHSITVMTPKTAEHRQQEEQEQQEYKQHEAEAHHAPAPAAAAAPHSMTAKKETASKKEAKREARKSDHHEPTDEELEKGLPEHHTKPPLAFHFSSIFNDLQNIHDKSHPDHEAFSADLRLPEAAGLKTDEERFAFVVESLYALEEHTDMMVKAFESILTSVDNERFRVQDNHHQFAEAFNALYDQVATKKDVEESLQALAGKVSLLKASRKIHKLVDSALESVEGSDSPLGKLAAIAKQMEPSGKDLQDRFARNRAALASAQNELAQLTSAARKSGRWGTLDYVMLAELAVFAVFVVFQALRKRQKQSLL